MMDDKILNLSEAIVSEFIGKHNAREENVEIHTAPVVESEELYPEQENICGVKEVRSLFIAHPSITATDSYNFKMRQ